VTYQTSETRAEHPATARIDGGPEQPATLFVYSRTTWVPSPFPSTDPAWEYIDAAGHWHGFTEDGGLLPTLDRDGEATWCRRRECDGGECPGVHPPAYTCKICAELIVPKFGPPITAGDGIPTVGRWLATVAQLPAPDPVRVQARFVLLDGTELVGIANTSAEHPGRLDGVGELATRGAAGRRPLPFHQVSHAA
jgi:hypothetical protein